MLQYRGKYCQIWAENTYCITSLFSLWRPPKKNTQVLKNSLTENCICISRIGTVDVNFATQMLCSPQYASGNFTEVCKYQLRCSTLLLCREAYYMWKLVICQGTQHINAIRKLFEILNICTPLLIRGVMLHTLSSLSLRALFATDALPTKAVMFT